MLKGEVFRASHKNIFQEKKHASQMNRKEKRCLISKLHSLHSELEFSNHVLTKKGISFDEDMVLELLNSASCSEIVEYNETTNCLNEVDCRILLRSHEAYLVNIIDHISHKQNTRLCNLCVVISLISGRVVTIYWNPETDMHKTLNKKNYNESLNIKFIH